MNPHFHQKLAVVGLVFAWCLPCTAQPSMGEKLVAPEQQHGVVKDGVEKSFYAYVDLDGPFASSGDAINFGVKDFVENVLPELQRNGFRSIVLSNYYLCSEEKLTSDDSNLVKNLKRLVAAAAGHEIEVIPEIMDVGSSSSILLNDPNLAEGTPVRDMEYLVKKGPDGKLLAEVKNRRNLIPHGNLDAELATLKGQLDFEYSKHLHVSQAGTLGPEDKPNSHLVVKKSDSEPGSFFLKANQIPLKPFHQYRLSFQIKTEGLELCSEYGFYALVQSRFHNNYRRLERVNHKIEGDQQWTTYVVSFNSLESSATDFVLGIEDILAGQVMIENLVLQESGAVNLLRRKDLPVVVVRPIDQVALHPQDVCAWIDEEMGEDGFYEHDESPAVLKISHDTKIKEGDTLLVSYYHAALPNTLGHQVCCSLTNDEVDRLMTMQIQQLNRIMGEHKPRRWIVNHDEIRAVGYEPEAKGRSPGKLLAGMLGRCLDIIQKNSPGSHVILISDMYDPFHNAVPWNNENESFHPMVNGSFEESWNAIPSDGSVSIWNWSFGETGSSTMREGLGSTRASFGFFDDLNLEQTVGGFYDVVEGKSPEDKLNSVRTRALKNFQVARKNGKINSVCYYTTKRNLHYLETFSEAADEIWPTKQAD